MQTTVHSIEVHSEMQLETFFAKVSKLVQIQNVLYLYVWVQTAPRVMHLGRLLVRCWLSSDGESYRDITGAM